MNPHDPPRTTTMARHDLGPANAIPGFVGRVSPYLEGVERAGGGGYRLHFNTFVPWVYPEDAAEQYRAVTERVTLWDTATERQLELKGADAIAFADYLVTRNLRGFEPGRCTYTFLCDQRGVIICDPVLLVVDDETVWLSISGTDAILWANAIALHTDFDVEVRELEIAPLQLQGPKARDVLQKITDPPIGDLGFFRCMRTKVAGIEAMLSRTGWTGELGYEIYPFDTPTFPRGRARAMQLWNAILEAGAEHGLLVTAFQLARAYEAGIMVFNHGYGENMNALEFWRDTVVDFDGGDFVGKAALEAIRDSGGPKRRLMGLVGESNDRIEPGAWDLPILDGEKIVGTTRRLTHSPALERTIAIGLMQLDSVEPGMKVEIEHAGGRSPAEVKDLPLVHARTSSP
jgi:glycine cleavage system aminomethyltransferase T